MIRIGVAVLVSFAIGGMSAAFGPASAQSAEGGTGAAVAPPDTSRIRIRRPTTDIVEPDSFQRGLAVPRGRDGHFQVRGAVNGRAVRFLFDTGASAVVLKYEDAVSTGIAVNRLSFTIPTQTANGRGLVAATVLDEIVVGTIRMARVRALVAPPGALDLSLLGNTFLNRLASFSVEGDRLLLRP